jgi:hypothetical protein
MNWRVPNCGGPVAAAPWLSWHVMSANKGSFDVPLFRRVLGKDFPCQPSDPVGPYVS